MYVIFTLIIISILLTATVLSLGSKSFQGKPWLSAFLICLLVAAILNGIATSLLYLDDWVVHEENTWITAYFWPIHRVAQILIWLMFLRFVLLQKRAAV